MKVEVGGKQFFLDFFHDPSVEHMWGKGVTFCYITDKPKAMEALYYGVAHCGSYDTFNKRKGRKVAFSNAIKSLPHEERKLWWAEYFKQMPKDLRA